MQDLAKIKDSALWADAEEQLKLLPIEKKMEIYAKIFYPDISINDMDLNDRLNLLFKIPDVFETLSGHLTGREMKVMEMLSYHCTYQEVCKEMGLTNRSAVYNIVTGIKRKVNKLIADIRTDKEIEVDLLNILED